MGGMLAAIESGWVQEQIHLAAYQWQREVEGGERVVVGVNRFADGKPVPPPPFAHDAGVEAARAEFLGDWRASRAPGPWRAAMDAVGAAARGSDNLVPPILAALVARATLGEVCDALRAVFGVHRPGETS